MNFYPFHLGDYHAHTAHLEPLEDLAYRRMLDAYYLREAPLPPDAAEVARLVRLRSHQVEVELVLHEFFVLSDDGWHHQRCDDEIARMQEKQSAAGEKSLHERERMRRHRERRAEMFADLRAVGITTNWDISMKDLEQLHSENCNGTKTDLKREQAISENAPATAIPIPIPTPIPTPNKKKSRKRSVDLVGRPDDVPEQLWEDWMTVRKAKGMPLTATAMDGLVREAGKAGFTVVGAIQLCVERGWAGFQASYVKPAAQVVMPNRRGQPAEVIVDPQDPDSRERIEADGIRLGIGPWKQLDDKTGKVTSWPAYMAKVKAARGDNVGGNRE